MILFFYIVFHYLVLYFNFCLAPLTANESNLNQNRASSSSAGKYGR